MKLKNTILFLIAIGFVITASCKKYPNGPLISLYTREHRVVGIWEVEYFEVNGYDSTSVLRSKPYYGMIELEKKGPTGEARYADYLANDSKFKAFGGWELRNNKKDLALFFDRSGFLETSLGPYRASSLVIWEIRRLTKKELWLHCIYKDSKSYNLKLKLYKDL